AAGVVVLLIGLFDMYAIAVWLAMLAPFVRRRTIVLVGLAATVVYQTLVALISGFQPLVLFIQVISVAIVVGGILVNLWLWHVAQEAHEGQEAKAGLAVSEARLRFAGDLNHLLGRSLTDIAERTAAAEDLLSRDPEAASREMARIRELTRDSLREVRTAVRDYRALDLDEALASVRAVLEAAEVRCAVSADTRDLAAETRTMLAGVLREGATNVLKHSAATRCAITIGDGVLEMTNDGVSQEAAGEGTGLRGLAQRVTAAGGGLTALTIPDGQFRLRVDYAVAKHEELATTRQAGEAR
ncbi:MAG: sensor histidine kinase, partial [Nonomuraea sp.]|nr:sensor histidine kinase [Nonomuraea sp.]